jgi:hypothetical protein
VLFLGECPRIGEQASVLLPRHPGEGFPAHIPVSSTFHGRYFFHSLSHIHPLLSWAPEFVTDFFEKMQFGVLSSSSRV